MKILTRFILIFACMAPLALVSACNTFEGFGKDLQSGGQSLEKAAEGRPDSVVASDKRINAEIEQLYASDSELAGANIGVSTYWGKVTLDGKVKSEYLQDRAVSIARSVSGVKQVISKITVIID